MGIQNWTRHTFSREASAAFQETTSYLWPCPIAHSTHFNGQGKCCPGIRSCLFKLNYPKRGLAGDPPEHGARTLCSGRQKCREDACLLSSPRDLPLSFFRNPLVTGDKPSFKETQGRSFTTRGTQRTQMGEVYSGLKRWPTCGLERRQTPNSVSIFISLSYTGTAWDTDHASLFRSGYSTSLSATPLPLPAFLTDHGEGTIMTVVLLHSY